MSELIVFDKYSIEELDVFWRKKDYEKIIQFFTGKYIEFIQSIKVVNLHSLEKFNHFYSVVSEIDDKRLLKYISEVDIQENELNLYLAKYIYSSKDDLIKKKFYKEFVPLKHLFEMIELCHEYELDEKNSFGYLMQIVSAAGNINSDFGYYVYQKKVKQYISELSYFEKKENGKKATSN